MGQPRILLADDNPEMRERVQKLLRAHFDIVGSVGCDRRQRFGLTF